MSWGPNPNDPGVLVSAANNLLSLVPCNVLQGLGNSPYWLQVSGTILYVLFTNDRKVQAYDISNPAKPVLLVTSATLGSSPAYIQVRGAYVYVTDQTDLSLRILNACTSAVHNSLWLGPVGNVTYTAGGGTGGGRFDVDAAQHYALIGGPESGGTALNIPVLVDVSTPTAPVIAGAAAAAIGSTHRGVANISATKWALCSRDDATVHIIDTTTPATPASVATFTTATGGTLTTPVLCPDGKTLYVGFYGSTGVFEAVDVTTPTAPVTLGHCQYANGGGSEEMVLRGNWVYIGCRAISSIASVNVQSSQNPVPGQVVAGQNGGTVTPGVAADPTGAFVYQTAAGITTNGMLQLWATPVGMAPLVGQMQALARSGLLG